MPSVVSFFGVEPIRIGGTETYARELSRQLGRHGWDSVLVFLTQPPLDIMRFLALPNVSIEVLDQPFVRVNLRAIRKMARILRSHKPNLLHLHYVSFLGPYPWLGRLLGVKKILFTDHSSQPAAHLPTRATLWKRQLARAINLPVSRVICVSKYGYLSFTTRDLISKDKCEMIYNGVDLSRVSPSQNLKTDFLRRFKIESGRKIVLQVSWIIPEKGIPDLLSAAQIVVSQNENVHFVFVGEGAYREEYMRQTAEMGLEKHVTWTGMLKDPFTDGVYDAADIVCQVSRWEEVFGWVIAEAMAYGKPIIATKVGGIPELVVDQESGFLLTRGDVQTLAEKILVLINDPRRQRLLGQAGQRTVQTKFDLKKNVTQVLQCYGIEEGYPTAS